MFFFCSSVHSSSNKKMPSSHLKKSQEHSQQKKALLHQVSRRQNINFLFKCTSQRNIFLIHTHIISNSWGHKTRQIYITIWTLSTTRWEKNAVRKPISIRKKSWARSRLCSTAIAKGVSAGSLQRTRNETLALE